MNQIIQRFADDVVQAIAEFMCQRVSITETRNGMKEDEFVCLREEVTSRQPSIELTWNGTIVPPR